MALDVKVLDKDQNEIDLRQTFEDDDIGIGPDHSELMGDNYGEVAVESEMEDNFAIKDSENLNDDDVFGDVSFGLEDDTSDMDSDMKNS